MATTTMKVEMETETCCVCGSGGELMTPEEHDFGAPPMQMPLRSMLLHLNNNKVVPDGRLCSGCIRRTQDAYEFSTTLSARAAPPLSEKIRALRRRLHELTQKIDVFIVVGGPGVNAGGSYSEEDIIMVERGALAAAAAADDEDLEKARNAKGDTVYQCSLCPLSFQRVSEYRAHWSSHGADGDGAGAGTGAGDALHSCWTCGAQFSARAALRDHKLRHHHDLAADHATTCNLCNTTFQSQSEYRRHEASCPATCPACGARHATRAALTAHVSARHQRHAPLVCGTCYAPAASPALLAAHALRHRQARQFVCGYDGCILRFGTRSYLMSHIRKCHVPGEAGPEEQPEAAGEETAPARVTDGAVPCQKQNCLRTFATVAAMKRHLRVHRNDTPTQESMEGVESAEGGEGEGVAEGEVGEEGSEGGYGSAGSVEYLEMEALEDLDHTDTDTDTKPDLGLL